MYEMLSKILREGAQVAPFTLKKKPDRIALSHRNNLLRHFQKPALCMFMYLKLGRMSTKIFNDWTDGFYHK